MQITSHTRNGTVKKVLKSCFSSLTLYVPRADRPKDPSRDVRYTLGRVRSRDLSRGCGAFLFPVQATFPFFCLCECSPRYSGEKAQLFWMSDRKWLDEALNSYDSAVNLHDRRVHHQNKTITKLKTHNIINLGALSKISARPSPEKRTFLVFLAIKGPLYFLFPSQQKPLTRFLSLISRGPGPLC